MSSIGSLTAPRVPVTTQSPVQQAPDQSPVQCAPQPPLEVPPVQVPPVWQLPPTLPPSVPTPPGQDGGQVPPTLPPSPPAPPTTGPTTPPTEPTEPPTEPTEPTEPTTPPTDRKDDGSSFNLKPWLIGAGVVAAGVAGVLAIREGANSVRNVRALNATANAFESGAMHQGGLQAISDAGLGARFTNGIGLGDKLLVATPGVNRMGAGGRLASVARGHLDHAELMASATALQRGAGDAVTVSEPLRASVLGELRSGRSLPSVLDDLDRSAAGARPYFTNPRLAGYWDNASIVEVGKRAGDDVTSAVTMPRPELGIVDGKIAETGGKARAIDRIVTGRGSKLGDRGLASGIGSLQAANVETLPPALRANAIAASGVDPQLVDTIGLRGAYVQRWTDRLA